MKNMKKQWKDCLEGEHEEIDTKNGKNNQQQVWSISNVKFQKDTLIILSVSTRNPPRTQQDLFWAISWQKKNIAMVFQVWPENMKSWKYH